MNDNGFNNVFKKSPPVWGYHTIEMADCPVSLPNSKKFVRQSKGLGEEWNLTAEVAFLLGCFLSATIH